MEDGVSSGPEEEGSEMDGRRWHWWLRRLIYEEVDGGERGKGGALYA